MNVSITCLKHNPQHSKCNFLNATIKTIWVDACSKSEFLKQVYDKRGHDESHRPSSQLYCITQR